MWVLFHQHPVSSHHIKWPEDIKFVILIHFRKFTFLICFYLWSRCGRHDSIPRHVSEDQYWTESFSIKILKSCLIQMDLMKVILSIQPFLLTRQRFCSIGNLFWPKQQLQKSFHPFSAGVRSKLLYLFSQRQNCSVSDLEIIAHVEFFHCLTFSLIYVSFMFNPVREHARTSQLCALLVVIMSKQQFWNASEETDCLHEVSVSRCRDNFKHTQPSGKKKRSYFYCFTTE